MANLAATDITVTFLQQRRNNGRSYNNIQLTFGDGAKTYPAGGVPISIAALGCPNVVESLDIFDGGIGGYTWSYDRTNQKLVAADMSGHGHSLFLKNAAVADAVNNRVNAAASNLLGANTGSNVTVVASDGATTGGVVTAAAGTLMGQPSTFAMAAQTLKCEVIGW